MVGKSVCFISPKAYNYFKPSKSSKAGGAERQQYMLGKELQQRGYDVSFIVGAFDGQGAEQFGDILVYKRLPTDRSPHSALYIIRLLRSLYEANADVYYTRGLTLPPFLISVYSSLTQSSSIYSVASDSGVETEYISSLNFLVRRLYGIGLKLSDHVVTQTEYQKDTLKNNLHIDSDVISNGYTIPPEEELVDHAQREYILWVGRLEEEPKAPHRFLDLSKLVSDEKFILIGPDGHDEEYNNEIKSRAKSISNVEFKGFVNPDKIHKYYSKSKVYVNTSDYEGFPNTYLEAWRYATPVVTMNHTFDGIFEGDAGFNSDSVNGLKDNINYLAKNKVKRREMGFNGRSYVKSKYSLKSVADKMETVINS